MLEEMLHAQNVRQMAQDKDTQLSINSLSVQNKAVEAKIKEQSAYIEEILRNQRQVAAMFSQKQPNVRQTQSSLK